MNEDIFKITDVRIAFPQLPPAKAKKFSADDDEGRYSAAAILQPSHADVARLRALENSIATAKWGREASGILTAIRANNDGLLRNGDAKANYAGYAGNLYVNASVVESKGRPEVRDADGTPVSSPGRIYAGCYVNMWVSAWAQDHPKGGKKINATLMAVQFRRDGDAFGSAFDSSRVQFEDLSAGVAGASLV